MSAEIDLEGKDLKEITEKYTELVNSGTVLESSTLSSIDTVLDGRTMEDLTEQFFKEYSS